MAFDLTKPCDMCPFSKGCKAGWLGAARASEIASSIIRGQSFPCHKTVVYDDDGESIRGDNEQHCAGSMILLEKINRPHQMMRIGERLGMYDPDKLDMSADVFDTPQAFIRHHSARTAKRKKAAVK
jgi:hypothetical protein